MEFDAVAPDLDVEGEQDVQKKPFICMRATCTRGAEVLA